MTTRLGWWGSWTPRDTRPDALDGLRGTGEDGPMTESSTPPENVDPVIAEAVENISNRFGTQGLCDLIALARDELARAEAALRELADPE